MKVYDSIIIGAGPAGLTASIYLSRANLDVLVIEKEAPGGKMTKTFEVENYPGYKKVSGFDLANDFYNHSLKYKTNFEFDEVSKVLKNDQDFFIVETKQNKYTSRTVIVASGTQERLLGVPGEERLKYKGVSYCAVCDGALYKDREVAVVGGGYSAIEESLFLTKFVKKVHLIHRRQVFRVPDNVLAQVKNHKKINLILDTVVTEIMGKDAVDSIKIKNTISNKETVLSVAAIFPYIGAFPLNKFLDESLKVKMVDGFLAKDEKCKTNVKGLFVAGDISNTPLRQIATAVSDGAIAAQFAISYINNV